MIVNGAGIITYALSFYFSYQKHSFITYIYYKLFWDIIIIHHPEFVSLHMASFPNQFSWHLIFVDAENIPHSVVQCVLEIRVRHCINDAETSSDSLWRHQMETFSALLANCAVNSPVSGEFPTQRPVTRSFDVFFDLRLNERLSKHSWALVCPFSRGFLTHYILYFLKYSCTNIFHRRGLYTFYSIVVSLVTHIWIDFTCITY